MFSGGLSGVAFGQGAALMSRITQGCRPVSADHEITACEANVVTGLDGRPALDVMLADLDVSLDEPREALAKVRTTLVGLSLPADIPHDGAAHAAGRRAGQFGAEVRVRHLIGLDPARRGIAIAEVPAVGMKLAFCERNMEAARADLIRVCAEIREELEPEEVTLEVASALSASEAESAPHAARRIAGAVYVSCSRPGRAALRRAQRRDADRAARPGRRAAGRLFRRRRNCSPPPLRLHRRVDGVHSTGLEDLRFQQFHGVAVTRGHCYHRRVAQRAQKAVLDQRVARRR